MKRKPSTEATAAWIRLMRVQSRVLDAVEQDLKKAGFPPLAWYDALLELSRAPSGAVRPVELEKQMLIPQYSTSRLIDRLVDEGLAARRECKIGAHIPPQSKSMLARSCQMWMRQGCAVCSIGWAARAMKLRRSPQETAHPRDDIVLTFRVYGQRCP